MSVSVAALLLSPALSHRASAFGGLWSSQRARVEQSAMAIVLVDNPDSTVTAVIQIAYEGPPQAFAWVIPVPGTPAVGVSSNTVFQRLDAATAPQYWVEVAVEGTCSQQDEPDAVLDAGSGPDGVPTDPDAAAAPILVIDQGSVGPYDYVNLSIDPAFRDPVGVAAEWLTMNGYDPTSVDTEVLGPYLNAGLNLLVFKLVAGADVGAIRPVMLTYDSELPRIPIRPTALAAQDDMGIQVWVIGRSQAVPANYKSLVINDARIDWLSGPKLVAGTLPAGGAGPFGGSVSKPANYAAVVTAAADEAGGDGFVTELGAPASQFRDRIWSALDADTFVSVSSQTYADGIDALFAAHALYGGWDGWRDAVAGATTLPAGVTLEQFGRNPDRYRGVAEVDVARFFELLDDDVVKPVADTAALLYRAPYLTRLYSTMSADEMTVDPAFAYNFDLAQISNVHVARQTIQCSPTLDRRDAPWRIELPQGGVIVGEGSERWPVSEDSMPANLKIVMLSSHGSGTLVEDNSEVIGMKLFETAGTIGSSMPAPQRPQHGVMIGGTQTVTTQRQAEATRAMPKPSASGACSVSDAPAGTGSALARWLLLAGALLAIHRLRPRRYAACVWAGLLVCGCSSGEGTPAQADAGDAVVPGALTPEQLRDPESCKGCHPVHYREWSGSMHAYASLDPVFLAMNRRGQRETNGELGDFCIKCHAPMAAFDGLTRDGLDLEQLPEIERGVSCYFCHNVIGVDGSHNGMLRLADDTTMRGPIRDPLQPRAHRAEFSEIFDEPSPQSSAMCGACHDIVTPNGVHLERTFEEYLSGIFSKSADGEPQAFETCLSCHMAPRAGFAAVAPGVGMRTTHEHLWPGVDVALTDFPNRDAMRSAVEECQLNLAVSFFTLEVTPPDLFSFQIETNAGHNTPSGAAQDRRMWLEFLAYDESGELLEDVSSGNIADGELEERPEGDPKHDPHLLMFRDRIYDAQGKPVHMFWQAAKSDAHPHGYESAALPVATTTYIEGKRTVLKQYRASGPNGLPARVTARLRMRPMGMDVLQDLVDSGDLDPAIVAQMPTFTFGTQIEWTQEDGLMKTISATPEPADCTTYRCLLDADSEDCN